MNSPVRRSADKKKSPSHKQLKKYEVPAVPYSLGITQKQKSASKDSICGPTSRRILNAPDEMSFDATKQPKAKGKVTEYNTNCKSERSNSA